MRYRTGRPLHCGHACQDARDAAGNSGSSVSALAGHRLLVTEHLLGEFGIGFARCLAVFAADVALDLLADRLVTAAEENVDRCLYADHLHESGVTSGG